MVDSELLWAFFYCHVTRVRSFCLELSSTYLITPRYLENSEFSVINLSINQPKVLRPTDPILLNFAYTSGTPTQLRWYGRAEETLHMI